VRVTFNDGFVYGLNVFLRACSILYSGCCHFSITLLQFVCTNHPKRCINILDDCRLYTNYKQIKIFFIAE
jgi:hypothetical protein